MCICLVLAYSRILYDDDRCQPLSFLLPSCLLSIYVILYVKPVTGLRFATTHKKVIWTRARNGRRIIQKEKKKTHRDSLPSLVYSVRWILHTHTPCSVGYVLYNVMVWWNIHSVLFFRVIVFGFGLDFGFGHGQTECFIYEHRKYIFMRNQHVYCAEITSRKPLAIY